MKDVGRLSTVEEFVDYHDEYYQTTESKLNCAALYGPLLKRAVATTTYCEDNETLLIILRAYF